MPAVTNPSLPIPGQSRTYAASAGVPVSVDTGTGLIVAPGTLAGRMLLPGSFPAMSPGRSAGDASVTSGKNTVNSAAINFTQDDVGSLVVVVSSVASAAPTIFTGAILSVSGSTATLTATSTTTITAGQIYVGPDNYSSLSAALLLAAAGATSCIGLPPGIFMLSNGVTVPDGITLSGQGRGGATYLQNVTMGTVLVAAGNSFSTTYAVQLGVTTSKSGPLRAVLQNLCVDAANAVATAVYQHGVASEVLNCGVRRGTAQALLVDSAIGKLKGSDVCQQLQGNTITFAGTQDYIASDNYIHGAAGTVGSPKANLYFAGGTNGDISLQGNHIWQESPISVNLPAHNIWINAASGQPQLVFTITGGNIFDCCYGHQLLIQASNSGAVAEMVVFNGNMIFQNDVNFPHNTFDIVQINAAAGSVIVGVAISGNVSANLANTNSFANAINPTGAGSITNITAGTNTFLYCQNITPAGVKLDGGNDNNTMFNQAGATKYSTNRGRSTQTGNGATVAFTIPHGLADTPQWWDVTPRVALAAPNFIVTADATNLTVTYATAPPASANNVDLQWNAGL